MGRRRKLAIGVLIIWLTLTSPPLGFADINRPEMRNKYNLYYGNFEGITDFKTLSVWIKKNVEYKNEYPDRWSDPRAVVSRGYGDCDDYALLYLNIAYILWGVELDFVAVNNLNRQDPEIEPNHAEIRYRWNNYDIYTGERIDEVTYIHYMYEFDELFRR